MRHGVTDDLCDQIGLMVQTDLPLFGNLRRNQFCEAMRTQKIHPGLYYSHLDWTYPDYPSLCHPEGLVTDHPGYPRSYALDKDDIGRAARRSTSRRL